MFEAETLRQAREMRQKHEAAVDAGPASEAGFSTPSGQVIAAVYDATDLDGTDYARDLGLPGQYPYTRGVHASGYRGKPWTLRMFSGFGSAEETNERYRYLLEHGETGLSVAFDMPTLMGYDHDDPRAYGEFGHGGVAIDSLADMELLFDRIPLGEVSTSMTINSPAAVIWAMYVAAAERQGYSRAQLRGTLQNDILKEYIAENEYIYPPEAGMRLVVDTIEFATREMPQWNSISVSGYHIREAGANAIQELAFTLADGIEYVKWCLERGLEIDEFAPRLSFFFIAHNDFFEEIAKFRAARRIWSRQRRERFGATNPRSWLMRFHAQTAGSSLTRQQPEVNLVRTAIQALAAVLGGAQSLHTNSWDETLALPSEKAARLALRTQQVILHESGVASTADPLGGGFFVESLTSETERKCLEYLDRIEAMGGVVAGINRGYFHQEIMESAGRYQQEIEAKERIIVGVNEYEMDEPLEIPLLRMDPEGAARHMERLRRVRATRDAARSERAMADLERATRAGENVMPHLIEAAHAYCTVGEICNTWRRVFGEQPIDALV